MVGEFGFLVEVEVAKIGDDGLDHVRLAGAVLADDGVAFDFALRAVGVDGHTGEGDLEIPQVAEVLNLEAFELHQSALSPNLSVQSHGSLFTFWIASSNRLRLRCSVDR
mgnify:CR=1 FL=1